jgi:hypothetical protein
VRTASDHRKRARFELATAQDALGWNPALSLHLADLHASRFPRSAVAQEREVIAIEALVRLDRIEERAGEPVGLRGRTRGRHTRRTSRRSRRGRALRKRGEGGRGRRIFRAV